MNKASHPSLPFVIALALGMGGSVALAKGPSPHDPVDPSNASYRCATLSESTGTAQKSAQRQATQHCIDTRESTPIAIDFWIDMRTTPQRGATTAKAPSRATARIASGSSIDVREFIPITTEFRIRTNP
jgi:hypothetical protein